jgi:hypothetical protein
MQLSISTARPAPTPPLFPDLPDSEMPVGVMRPGGPNSAPGPNVVGQAKVNLPMNFGLQGWLDVEAGARLGTFASLADAQQGVFRLATGRPSVGILREGDRFSVAELLVPDFLSVPIDGTWAGVRPTPLVLGQDPARVRSIESVRALPERGTRPELLDLYVRGGMQRVVLG